MKTYIFEKGLVRKPNGRIDTEDHKEKEIEYNSVEGAEDFLWYLLESAIPEQIPYCPDCVSMGKQGVVQNSDSSHHKQKDGYCSYHKQTKSKYAFKTLNKHQIQTNIEFAKGASWLIASLCDASARRFDHKKIIKGIININKNNKELSFKNLCDSISPQEKLDNLLA